MAKNRKKVVLFIVEGSSEEIALGSIMKEFFANNEVRFEIIRGDITSRNDVTTGNVISKINEYISICMSKYSYKLGDILKIIHLTDTDGVFIADEYVQEDSVKEVQYKLDKIVAPFRNSIILRNYRKSSVTKKLVFTNSIRNIPYKIYFNSCNLEHVLYGQLQNFTAQEKVDKADDFALEYENKLTDFKEFIFSKNIAVEGTYRETWEYIQKDLRSLNRGSNMHLIFEAS